MSVQTTLSYIKLRFQLVIFFSINLTRYFVCDKSGYKSGVHDQLKTKLFDQTATTTTISACLNTKHIKFF